MRLLRALSSVLANVGLAATLACSVTSPALAQSAVTAVRADACLDKPVCGIEWIDAANEAYDALPDGDERLSMAVVFEPKFAGPRAFNEPSGFDTTTLATWDHTRFVADDVVETAVVGKHDAGPLSLAGHALYGMGKQVWVMTAGTAVSEVREFAAHPIDYELDRIPVVAQVRQTFAAPETIPLYYKIATEAVPAKWNEFLAAKDTEQAEMIGATAATVGVLLSPMAEGTGSAAADRMLARWTKLKGDLLAKAMKEPKAGALSLIEDAKTVKKGSAFEPVPTPPPGPIPTPTKSAFEIANEGGKHSGFLKNYQGKPAKEIQKGIDSIEEQIALHKDKIAFPEKHIPDWKNLDPRQQKALVEKKWPSDIQRQEEQADILRGLLGESR